MNWIRNKLRIWLGVDQNLQSIIYQQKEIIKQQADLNYLQKVIKDRTEYNLDIHQGKGSQVILIGKYQNVDFVHCYALEDNDFGSLVQHCIELEKLGHRNKMDVWPNFKATINNELAKAGY